MFLKITLSATLEVILFQHKSKANKQHNKAKIVVIGVRVFCQEINICELPLVWLLPSFLPGQTQKFSIEIAC